MALGIIILYQVLPILLIIFITVSFILIRKSPSKLRWIALSSNVFLLLLWFHYLGREVFDRSISSATAPKIELQASKNFHQPIIIIRVTHLDQTPHSKMIYPLKDLKFGMMTMLGMYIFQQHTLMMLPLYVFILE